MNHMFVFRLFQPTVSSFSKISFNFIKIFHPILVNKKNKNMNMYFN